MNYDVIIIGSGPGGYVAAIRAAQLGMKVGVVEREDLGGVCLNWGCIPTKALLKSAQVFEYIQHSKEYGIEVSDAKVDFGGMISRSRGIANGMNNGIKFLFRKNKIETLEGNGKLLPGKRVQVTDKAGKATVYTAKNVILATGGRSKPLPNVPIDDKKVIGYRKAMTLDKQPESMVVIGAGAIGMEFAYFYNAIGTKVTVVEYLDGLLPREDKDVSKEIGKAFKKSGVKVKTGHAVQSVDASGNSCKVVVKNNKSGKEEVIECDIVLSAVGVQPNTQNIGLEEVGVKTDRGFVLVDGYYKTNIDGVFAIGDIIPTQALAHVASAEGIVCVEKIAGLHTETIDYMNIPSCTYCSPEVASVGYTEEAAKEAGYELKVGKFPFTASGNAKAAGVPDGFVKVIYDAKYGELLGAHMVGANVTEMIAEMVAARKLETTGHEILKTIHPHPTMSEAVMEATAAAYDEVIHL
jgi:dihydrolipoamide dehydrogenase